MQTCDRMSEKGYSDPLNGERFWCSTCLDWVVTHITDEDKAICHDCLSEVFTPNEIQEWMEKNESVPG